jgi:hypothetical protein
MSILLALLIFFRINLFYSIWIKRANVLLYYLTYYILPCVAFFFGFLHFHQRDGRKLTNRMLMLIYVEFAVASLAFLPVALFSGLPEYYLLPLPLILILGGSLVRYRPIKRPAKIVAPLLAAALVFSFFLPLVTASFSNSLILQKASAIQNKEDQVRFIAQKVLETTTNVGVARTANDYEKLILAGDGACGEGALFMVTFLQNLGFEARQVGFPGEDHAMAEVRINSTWFVVDPGYSLVLVSEQTRGERRIQEAGTLTYVAAYSNSGFTELTQQYVKTDTIIVRVLQNGEPVTDAGLTLTHTLVTDGNSRATTIPGNGLAFHTDFNGTATIHLGKIEPQTYNSSFTQTDQFYLLYVNGKSTDQKVTSTGNGIIREICVDI